MPQRWIREAARKPSELELSIQSEGTTQKKWLRLYWRYEAEMKHWKGIELIKSLFRAQKDNSMDTLKNSKCHFVNAHSS